MAAAAELAILAVMLGMVLGQATRYQGIKNIIARLVTESEHYGRLVANCR
jgi:hypothetical protein